MDATFFALDTRGRNRFQEQTLSVNSSPPIGCWTKSKHGYCETCKSWKPAPKKRSKGWKCNDCVTPTNSKLLSNQNEESGTELMTKIVGAASPSQVLELKTPIPQYVFDAFHSLMAEKISRVRPLTEFRIDQDDVILRILSAVENLPPEERVTRQEIFDRQWLDVDVFFREKDWSVRYEKPGFGESGNACFFFKAEKMT